MTSNLNKRAKMDIMCVIVSAWTCEIEHDGESSSSIFHDPGKSGATTQCTREGLVNMSVQFMRDPTNTHDRYCVEVFLCGGRKLGHVARISSMEISYLLPRSFDTKGEAEQTRMCACTIRV